MVFLCGGMSPKRYPMLSITDRRIDKGFFFRSIHDSLFLADTVHLENDSEINAPDAQCAECRMTEEACRRSRDAQRSPESTEGSVAEPAVAVNRETIIEHAFSLQSSRPHSSPTNQRHSPFGIRHGSAPALHVTLTEYRPLRDLTAARRDVKSICPDLALAHKNKADIVQILLLL